MTRVPPLARTHLEAHLYIALHPCSCGRADMLTTSVLSQVDDVWVVRYEGDCTDCGRPRTFEFSQPAEFEIPVGDAWADTQEPSQLLDAGEWLSVADTYGEAPTESADLSADEMQQAAADLRSAAAALDEVLKFLPPGIERVPDSAFWSVRGTEVRRRTPGRFLRVRLEASRETYLQLAGAMDSGSARPEAAPQEGAAQDDAGTDPWERLAFELSEVLEALPDNVVLQFYEAAHPAGGGRYAQLWRDSAGLHTEVSGNESLDPRRWLTPEQEARIAQAGWNPPGGMHPANWWRDAPPTAGWDAYWEVAHGLVRVLVSAFGAVTLDNLTYRAWYAGGGRPLYLPQLGIDPVSVQYYVLLGEGDTVEEPGALLRRVVIGKREIDQVHGERGWEPSDALQRAEADAASGEDTASGELVPVGHVTAMQVVADREARAEGRPPFPRAPRWADELWLRRNAAGQPLRPATLLPDEERILVVEYLRQAPIVLLSGGLQADPYDPQRPEMISMDIHTDGAWVWSRALAYFAERYGHPPEPEFLAHIRRHNYRVPDVSEQAMVSAERLLSRPASGEAAVWHHTDGARSVTDVARLAAALGERIEAYRRGDSRGVLDPRAMVEGRELLNLALGARSTPPLDVALLVARLHWYRYLALPTSEGQASRRVAVALFAMVAGIDPQAVPELDEAVHLLRQEVRANPHNHTDRGNDLSRLEVALRARFERDHALADLDEAIEVGRQAMHSIPSDHPDRARCLSNLGTALRDRFGRVGAPADLDEAIDVGRLAVRATPEGYPGRVANLLNLEIALRTRFGRDHALADLDEAIEVGRQTIRSLPNENPGRATCLSNLGTALRDRFELVGVLADLDEAIDLLRQAVKATPGARPERAEQLNILGLALNNRFGRIGALADLDEAIDILRQAARATPDDHPEHAGPLVNLGGALIARFGRAGATADLDEAIDLLRQAARATPDNHPQRAGRLSDFGSAMLTRFDRAGALADLDEAIDLLRQAVRATPDDHPRRATFLSNLGAALNTRFGRTGAVADLDEAIDLLRQAVRATPDNHPNRAGPLVNLGKALRDRYDLAGAMRDLDETVDLFRQAVRATAGDHPRRATFLSNLGAALNTRFGRTGDLADLDKAIDLLRQAVRATAGDHPDRVMYQSNLGGASLDRFRRVGAMADLNEGIDLFRRAVRATPDDHPDRAMRLSNLGAALDARFGRAGAVADLNEGIDLLRQAVRATPDDHPDRAGRLSNLGVALRDRYNLAGDMGDLDEAIDAWTSASRSTVATTAIRLIAAHGRSEAIVLRRGSAAAVEAYSEAVNLLPLLAWRGITDRDQQYLLGRHAPSLARDAAGCAIAAGHLDLAVELLEAGRGVYWSQLLGTRTDLTILEHVAPSLAAQLRDCRTLLDQPTPDSATEDRGLSAQARMDAAARFDELVEQVRTLGPTIAFPFPDRFLKPPALDSLLPGLTQDPVVVINVSRWRCDALIVTSDGPALVALPDVTEDQVNDEANLYLEALERFDHSRRTDSDRRRLEAKITETLKWLWDHVAAPILERLGHTSTPSGTWHRLWWCPTGLLTVLPLSAAGHHGTDHTVLDRVVSSYTPTLRTLVDARTRPPSKERTKMLVVTVPDTPGQARLPGATLERDQLTKQFAPDALTVLTGNDATRDRVLSLLSSHRWLHASCHGTQNLADPSSGGLLPFDWGTAGLISVTDLTRPEHTGGEFAFLSACKTATGGVTNPDEVITVAAAMQHAGWRHVVGTLWSVWDHAAATVALCLYPQVTHDHQIDPTNAAHALHDAVRTLRDIHREHPSTWAPFIHAGP